MNADDVHHLSAAYALDALDPAERVGFESHLPRCPRCVQEIAEFRATTALLGAADASAPPSALRASVLDAIATERQLPPMVDPPQPAATLAPVDQLAQRRARPRGRMLLATAAAVMAIAGFGVGLAVFDRETPFDDVATVLEADDAVMTTLAGDDPADGTLSVVWSPSNDQAAVIAADLDDPGEGRAYALWFLLDDGVAPAALFQPTDGMVRTVLDLDDVDGVGWGITIEPETGSPQPTTPVLYSGEI